MYHIGGDNLITLQFNWATMDCKWEAGKGPMNNPFAIIIHMYYDHIKSIQLYFIHVNIALGVGFIIFPNRLVSWR